MAKVDWRSTAQDVSGPRRLNRIVNGEVDYHPSEEAARRAWAGMCRRLEYTPEKARSAVIVDFVLVEGRGWKVRTTVHPACGHWHAAFDRFGVESFMGNGTEDWSYVQPPLSPEEIAMRPKGHGGRHLP